VQWNDLSRLNIVVSVDGLQPERDVRRKPATYDRILKNIAGSKVTIRCTVTGQMMERPGYMEEFVRFWSARKETKRIWFSLFTPQQGRWLPNPDTRSAQTVHQGTASIASRVSLDRAVSGLQAESETFGERPVRDRAADRRHLLSMHWRVVAGNHRADFEVYRWAGAVRELDATLTVYGGTFGAGPLMIS